MRLLRTSLTTTARVLFALDALLVLLSWPIVLWFGHSDLAESFTLHDPRGFLYPVLNLLSLYAMGLYRREAMLETGRSLTRVPLVCGMGAGTVVLISLTPVIPALVMMRVYLTFVRQMDEFNRRIQSEAWLISAGLVGFGTFTYSFLEEWAHFPRLDLVWVFPALIGMWGLATFFVKRRYQ